MPPAPSHPVVWNGVPGQLLTHHTFLVFTSADASASTAAAATTHLHVEMRDVVRVMISKKFPLHVRCAIERMSVPHVDVVFSSVEARDEMIARIAAFQQRPHPLQGPLAAADKEAVKSEGDPELPMEAEGRSDTAETNAPSIKEELESLEATEAARGSVFVFDALKQFVNPVTLELRPVTEQLEADALRQNPSLADVYARRVTNDEDRQAFWTAVIRRCLCFSSTFLDAELLHQPSSEKSTFVATADSANAAKPHTEGEIDAVNMASSVAVPRDMSADGRGVSTCGGSRKRMVRDQTEEEEEEVGLWMDPTAAESRWDAWSTTATGKLRRLLFPSTGALEGSAVLPLPGSATSSPHGATSCATSDLSASMVLIASLHEAPVVMTSVPKSAERPDVTRNLRRFWSLCTAAPSVADDQRQALAQVRQQLQNDLLTLKPETIWWRCVKAALLVPC